MSPLTALLRAAIAQRGSIPFRDFMAAALYHPEHGYYSSGRAQIGRGGDFITSVSVGPLFGTLLARQFEEMWQRLDCPERFTLVEQGAHTGDFARDVLSHLRLHAPVLRDCLKYLIVEPSPHAHEVQREKLGAFAAEVQWVASVEELPAFTGVHFSNELLDAFPVHLIRWDGAAWVERHVAVEDERFVFTDAPLSTEALRPHLPQLTPPPLGFQTEINLAALDWIGGVAAKLARGFILTIDYGLSRAEAHRPERLAGTLSAYSRHQRIADPLTHPGEIDLTSHVEFTTLAERAEAADLRLAGFTDQHHFLVGLSQLHFTDETPSNPQELRAFKTLMHPDLLGSAFKALCLEKRKGNPSPLAGFLYSQASDAALGLI